MENMENMEKYVKLHSLDRFQKNPNIEADAMGDYYHVHHPYFIFKQDVGEVINILSSRYLDGNVKLLHSIEWAIERYVTREENPEYFL